MVIKILFIAPLIAALVACEVQTPPVPLFKVTPSSGNPKTYFDFDASASYDNESEAVAMQFRWDFLSDGKWDTQFAFSPFATYRFKDYGIYTVTLELRDGFGLTARATGTVEVVQQDSMQDPRDGRWYKVILIGTQVWMAENLNIGVEVDSLTEQTNNGIIEKYCWRSRWSFHPGGCEINGGLYQWDEAMNYYLEEGTQGICPPGWHIPTDRDWQQLMDNFHFYRSPGAYYISGNPFIPDRRIVLDEFEAYEAGKYLMGWESPSGFNGIYAGFRNPAGWFDFKHYYFYGYKTAWWSSTRSDEWALIASMLEISESPERFADNKKYGYYVRCIRN